MSPSKYSHSRRRRDHYFRHFAIVMCVAIGYCNDAQQVSIDKTSSVPSSSSLHNKNNINRNSNDNNDTNADHNIMNTKNRENDSSTSNIPDNIVRLKNSLHSNCKMSSLALISNAPYQFQRFLTNFIAVQEFPFINYDYIPAMYKFLYEFYVKCKRKYFVIATDNPGEVLNRVESVFREESHGQFALLPHKTKWVVIVWTRHQWKQVVNQQLHSVLDNVAVIKVNQQIKSPFPYEIQDIATFMWRKNRTREPSKVDMKLFDTDDDCVLFPNIKYGLNGRKLVVGPKVFLKSFLHTEKTPDGKEVFKGVLIHVLNYSSRSSNFTYVLHSATNTFAYRGINWDEYADFVNNGSMDIGLSTWPILLGLSYNLTFSYPVAFGTIVGVYRRPTERRLTRSWVYVFPFPVEVNLLFSGGTMYISLLYVLIVSCWNRCHPNGAEKSIKGKNSASVRRRSKFRSILGEYGDGNTKTRARKIHNTFVFCLSTYSLFVAAILNQGYLPRPQQVSARIVVGVWALGTVLTYAFYSSCITAQAVKPLSDLPFKTFNGMLQRKDYIPTMLNESVLQYSMRIAKKGSLVAKLKSITETVDTADGDVIDEFLPEYLANLKHKRVFIHYENAINDWLRSHAHAKDYFVMSNNPLFNSDICIVFPHGSELKEVISIDIRRLYESGIQFRYLKNFSAPIGNRLSSIGSKVPKPHTPVTLDHLIWLGIVCSSGLALAMTALGLEVLLRRFTYSLKAFIARYRRS